MSYDIVVVAGFGSAFQHSKLFFAYTHDSSCV